MGRTVVAEKGLEASSKLLPAAGVKYGLIIGQNTPSRAMVAHLARTPPEPNCATEEQPAGYISDSWIAKHAKQVIRLLPGGLDILGLFVVGSSDLLKTRETQLRSALTAIYRALDKLQLHDATADERLVATLDPRTARVQVRALELSNLTAQLRPAEWRFQELRWHRANSPLHVDVTYGVTSPVTETSLYRQLSQALQPWLAELAGSRCLVDGRLAEDEDAPLSGSDEKPGKSAGRTFTVDLLTDTTKMGREIGAVTRIRAEQVEAVLRITGRVHCLAYLHTKATVAETLAALCRDVRRSLLARCQMHCDSLVEEGDGDGEQGATVLHEPPRRVLAPLGGSTVCVSDYLFPGDCPADSLQTFADLFGLNLDPDDVIDTVEMTTEERANSECSSEAEAIDDLQDLQTGAARVSWLQMLGVLAVAVIGVAISSLALIGPRPPDQRQDPMGM